MEIWEQQCEAALRIRDDFGWWKAAGYLVGEKFLGHLEYQDQMPEGSTEAFADRIRETIPRNELESYFKNVDRVGPLGHVMDDDNYRETGVTMEDKRPSDFAEDALLLERARKILLGS